MKLVYKEVILKILMIECYDIYKFIVVTQQKSIIFLNVITPIFVVENVTKSKIVNPKFFQKETSLCPTPKNY